MTQPKPRREMQNEICQSILGEDYHEFSQRRCKSQACERKNLGFRSQVLRKFDVGGIDFSRCYVWQADLRGLNMSTCDVEGASIHGAKISGTYFPSALSSQEILLSLAFGTRMRCQEQ